MLQEIFYQDYMQREYDLQGPRISVNELWICEDDIPPEYVDKNGILISLHAYYRPSKACHTVR